MGNMSDKMDMDSGMDMSKKKDDMKMPSTMPMKMMAPTDVPTVSPVAGYSEGERILYLHTEASDLKIAQLLTDMLSDMMGSPVVFAPSLSRAPVDLLATVFAFANGVKPDGAMEPLEFQPDVFDFPPDHAGYRPLRRIVFVRWHDSEVPRILTSANDVARRSRRPSLA